MAATAGRFLWLFRFGRLSCTESSHWLSWRIGVSWWQVAVVVVNSTRCYSMFFLLVVGMMFGAIAHIGKKDRADLIGSGFWKIWIKPRYEYSMFCDFVHPFGVKIHWFRWSFPLFMLCIPASGLNDKTYFVQRLSTLCESLYGFVRFPNLRSQTTMTWQLKVGSKYTHQTPLTSPERCQFKF